MDELRGRYTEERFNDLLDIWNFVTARPEQYLTQAMIASAVGRKSKTESFGRDIATIRYVWAPTTGGLLTYCFRDKKNGDEVFAWLPAGAKCQEWAVRGARTQAKQYGTRGLHLETHLRYIIQNNSDPETVTWARMRLATTEAASKMYEAISDFEHNLGWDRER